jgi:hypothetical protein
VGAAADSRATGAPGVAFSAGPGLDAPVEQALAYGLQLIASAETFAAQLDLSEGVDLPALAGGEADHAALRAVAPLYLASELEGARLLPVVETLAGLFASGAMEADLGPVAEKLVAFWRSRHERFTAQERRAFFARLFGGADGPELAMAGARNVEFENLMIGLCDELYQLETDSRFPAALPQPEARLRVAANLLVGNLLPRSGGIAVFAARDILAATMQALEILKSTAIQRAAGAHSAWQAVDRFAMRYLRERVPVAAHVTRAREGQIVLAWLSEAPLGASGGAQLIRGGEPVIAAARAWMEASLELAG